MYNWDWKALLIDNGTPFTASPILKETACGGTEFYLLLDITVTEGYVTLTFPARRPRLAHDSVTLQPSHLFSTFYW